MVEGILWSPIDRLIYIFNAFIFIIAGYKYYKLSQQKEKKGEKTFLLGFALFLFFEGFGIPFYFLEHFYQSGPFYNPEMDFIFTVLGHFFLRLGILFFTIYTEKSLSSKKPILSSIATIFFIINMIEILNEVDVLGNTFFLFAYITPVWILIKADNEYQNFALFILIGAVFLLFLTVFDVLRSSGTVVISYESLRLLFIIGGIPFILPAYIDIKKFSRIKPLYSFLLIFVLCSLIFIISVFMYPVDEFTTTIYIVGFSIIFAAFFYVMRKNKIIQNQEDSSIRTSGVIDKNIGVFSAFSKPKSLTEEEVSISKEKKICLVCKSSIAGHTFVCVDCGTFYCNKCYSALTGLENMCWSCNIPLDETKPIQKVEKEKLEELEVEQELHKGEKK